MKVDITSKDLEITTAIRTHIEQQLSKMDKYKTVTLTPRLIIRQAPVGFEVEIKAVAPKSSLFAMAAHENLYHAINQVTQRIQRQVKEINAKQTHRKGRSRADRLQTLTAI